VVEDGENGWVLPEVSGSAIASCLKSLVNSSTSLKKFSTKKNFTENQKDIFHLRECFNQFIS